jgi:hypothetical protein
LALHGLSYVHGTWTHEWQLGRVFRTKREAIEYLACSDLPVDECAVVPKREIVPKGTIFWRDPQPPEKDAET